MDAKAKLAGHPIHQMLVVFPLGLLATSLIFDFIYLGTGNPRFADVSYWVIIAGVVGGLAAAVFGLIDWLAIPANTRAKAIGLWHGIGNVVVVVLFLVSWAIRTNVGPVSPPGGAIVLSCLGIGLALVTGWLGGELVDRMGVGVDEGAHLNSPTSLSNRPATESDPNYMTAPGYTSAAPSTPVANRIPGGRMAEGGAASREQYQTRSTPDTVSRPSDRGQPPV
jgi:uncharacterized membrane protein